MRNDIGRINLVGGTLPADATVHATDPYVLGRLPEAAEYLCLQAAFTYAPAGSGFGYALQAGAASHAASKVKVTIVDTTPSIVAGTLRIGGVVGGVATYEDISIAAGAGVYTTVADFTSVTLVKTVGVSVLGGAGDETLAAEWNTGAQSIVNVTNLVEQTETLDVWVQTTLDNEQTWCDIAAFRFTVSSARKVSAVRLTVALAANTTPTDKTMTADTILSGLLGNMVRVAWQASHAYTGSSLELDMTAR